MDDTLIMMGSVQGVLDLTLTAKQLGVPKTTLHGWYHATSRISLPSLANICYVLRVDLEDLLKCKVVPNRAPNTLAVLSNQTSPSTNKITTEALKARLRNYLSDSNPKSLTTVARELGKDRRYFTIVYPHLAKQIVARYRLSHENLRDARFARLSEAIHQTVCKLLSNGLSPTQRNVENA